MSNFEHVDPTLRSSQAEVWYLKPITFQGKNVPIITQNFNGPCSFIAICNILILRRNIIIEPPTRKTVSYEFLSQLVAEYLLSRSPNVDISAALSIMPHTQKGLDLNPLFTSPTSFSAATQTAGGELKLFSQVGIDLVHGWLVEPDSPEARAIEEEKTEDYDSAVGLIAEADHVAGGLLVPEDGHSQGHGDRQQGRGGEESWTAVDRRKIRNAMTIRHFLERTQSQLTYHGLFHLASTLPSGSLVALFRSSHLSVLYKSEAESDDVSFVGERGGKWRMLDDADTSHRDVNPFISTYHSTTSTTTEKDPLVHPTPLDPFATPITNGSRASSLPSDPLEPLSSPSPSPNPQGHREPEVASLYKPSSPNQPLQSLLAEGPQLRSTTIPPQAQVPSSFLYTLATDQVFLYEPSVAWERIEDVDGSAGVFVDSSFTLAVPVGGDWAGRTAEDAMRDYEREDVNGEGLSDAELARQLQAEEEGYALQQRRHAQQWEARENEKREKEMSARRVRGRKREGEGKKTKDCIVM